MNKRKGSIERHNIPNVPARELGKQARELAKMTKQQQKEWLKLKSSKKQYDSTNVNNFSFVVVASILGLLLFPTIGHDWKTCASWTFYLIFASALREFVLNKKGD